MNFRFLAILLFKKWIFEKILFWPFYLVMVHTEAVYNPRIDLTFWKFPGTLRKGGWTDPPYSPNRIFESKIGFYGEKKFKNIFLEKFSEKLFKIWIFQSQSAKFWKRLRALSLFDQNDRKSTIFDFLFSLFWPAKINNLKKFS